MQPIDYLAPTRFVLHDHALDALEDVLSRFEITTLLWVSSGDYVDRLGIADRIDEIAKARGFRVIADRSAEPNPKIGPVRALVDLARREHVDLVVGIGGGSSIDTAKAVALGARHDGDVWDFFEGNATPAPSKVLPVGAISTLPGTGAEASDCAVIQNGERKVFFEDDAILPRFAVSDPSWSLTAPYFYQAAAIADMSAHLLETYATDVPADATDRLIEASFASLVNQGRRFIDDPADASTRAELHVLSVITHNDGFLNNGRLADWVGHKVEHELSGLFGLVHGEGMALVTPAWVRYVADRKPAKLVQFASRVFGIDAFGSSGRLAVRRLADELEAFYRALGLRTRLPEFDIPESAIGEVARRATWDGERPVGHYLTLGTDEVATLLRNAL